MLINPLYLALLIPFCCLTVYVQYILCKNATCIWVKLIPACLTVLIEISGILLTIPAIAVKLGTDPLLGMIVIAGGAFYGALIGIGWIIRCCYSRKTPQ